MSGRHILWMLLPGLAMAAYVPVASARAAEKPNILFIMSDDHCARALSEVRDVKADLFSRQSSVLGTLPGPVETAAHQMRCRPMHQPPMS